MLSHLDNLLRVAANDGAAAPVPASSLGHSGLADDLMEAWSRERHERIEIGLFLNEAQVLLKRILAEGGVTSANRRKVQRLLRALEAAGPGTLA